MDQLDPSVLPPGIDPSQVPNDIDANDLASFYYSCNEVTPLCPVEATTMGYYPTRGINIFFVIGYAIAAIVTLFFGIQKKTWSYMAFIAAGSALEMAGYSARIPLTDNPWNKHAFETQIVAIILGPTLICISIYLTLKHICLSLNPALSRIRPHRYPFIFVPLDVSCLFIQAIGGALAASAALNNYEMVQHGNRCIIAGIVLQVVVLMFFGLSALDYYIRVRRWIKSDEALPEALELWKDKQFRMFVYAVTGAYSGILIRCIYRIVEMAGGWGNPIMQDEPSFIVLEGFMVLIACLLLACFPPGILFPQMAARMAARPSWSWLSKRKKDHQVDIEQQSQPEQGSQKHTFSGDESGLGESQAKDNVSPASITIERANKEKA